MKIVLWEYILVKELQEENGPILGLPSKESKKYEVILQGTEVKTQMLWQKVILADYAGEKITVNSEQYKVIKQSDILLLITEENE